MQPRTLSDVEDELREEGHEPMADLVSRISQESWSPDLGYDLSMLRLLVSRRESNTGVEDAVVTYGDGRLGGKPVRPFVDRFDVTTSHYKRTAVSAAEVVELLNELTR